MVMEEGIMRTANYTDLRANLKGYIDSVIDDYDTVIINRGNGKGVVMISLDEYNSLKETEYIMSSPETMAAIRQGEEDIKNGKRIKRILLDIREHPYTGIAKPEPLKYDLTGKWSRRINEEHRIIYSVNDDRVEIDILSMRYHYSKK